MKKATIFLSSFLLLQVISFGQLQRITIKVINAVSQESLESASVEVEQMPGVIPSTDQSGIAIFDNVPEGRITIRTSKSGFISKVEYYNHVSGETKNNYYLVELMPVALEGEYLFYGEVKDVNGNDIKNADIELKILDIVKRSKSDNSGNYSFKVKESILLGSRDFKIEVRYSGCEKTTLVRRAIPKQKNVEVNITTECQSKKKSYLSNLPQQWEGSYEQVKPSRSKYPMILYIESIRGGILTGKINWPTINNSVTSFQGELIDRPSGFMEEIKWRFTDEQLNRKDGIWFKFVEDEIISGRGIMLNTQYYCNISDNGILIGTGFIQDNTDKAGIFKLFKR